MTVEKQKDLFQAQDKVGLAEEVPMAFKDPQEGLKGNLGEWSEVYTFLNLLAKGSLEEKFEDHLHNTVARRVQVVNVIRNVGKPTLYHVASKRDPRFKNEDIYVRESDGANGFMPTTSMVIPREEVKIACDELATALMEKSKSKSGGKASFGLPKNHPTMLLIKKLGWKSIKAPSDVKADLILTTSTSPERITTTTQTYSIKSSLGHSATLFNANKTTNLDYDIVPIDPTKTKPFDAEMAKKINAIDKGEKIKDRMSTLKQLGYKLVYAEPQSNIFSDNLRSSSQGQEVDKILQAMLRRYFYADGEDKRVTAIKDFMPMLIEEDPLDLKNKFNNQEKVGDIYRQTLKTLLSNMALGMTSSKEFNSEKVRDSVSGGMLVVNANQAGVPQVEMHSVLHLKQLEEYLFEKTMFETASTKRHQFACAYFNDEAKSWRMPLNIQIRFIKEKAPKPVKAQMPHQMRMF